MMAMLMEGGDHSDSNDDVVGSGRGSSRCSMTTTKRTKPTTANVVEGGVHVASSSSRLKIARIVFVVCTMVLGSINLASISHSLKQISDISTSSTAYDNDHHGVVVVRSTATTTPETSTSSRTARRLIYDDEIEQSQSQSPPQQQQQPKQQQRPSIVLFGDSLTQRGFGENGNVGWASLLASDYTRIADVKNRGFGGYNTHHALKVWPEIEDSYSDDILFCTLFFGANDATLPGHPQHLSLEEYHDNLTELITKIRSKLQQQDDEQEQTTPTTTTIPIFLFTPPPVDEIVWAKTRSTTISNRLNNVTKSYGDVVKRVAQEQQQQQQHQLQEEENGTVQEQVTVSVLDTWELLEGNTSREVYGKYLSDGLHLNEAGNRKIYQSLINKLQKEFSQLAPKTHQHPLGIPFQHKSWQEYE